MKRLLRIALPLIAIALITTIGTWYYHHTALYPSTDDAYVKAYTVNIAPQISGTVAAVYVIENQYVTKGTPLLKIDPEPFQLAVNEAQSKLEQIRYQIQGSQMRVDSAHAKLEQSEAELTNTRLASNRVLSLVSKGYSSKADGDNAVKNLKVAEQAVNAAKSELKQAMSERGAKGADNAQLKSAENTLAKAKLDLSYTTLTAPANGYIQNFDLRKGAVVSAFQQVFALVETESWWVNANFKETDLEHIRPNQVVKIKLDMYPKHTFHGRVSSLSSSTSSSFSLLPPENASANWVKVTQRFPIRILITDPVAKNYPLRMGASATVVVNTTK